MKAYTTLRASFYLLLSLSGMLLGSRLPSPFSSLCHLGAVGVALLVEWRVFEGEAVPALDVKPMLRHPRLWLLLPAFILLTLGANLLSAHVAEAFGAPLPTVTPSLPLFLGAVLIAPIAEELLFRGLILKLLLPYGEAWAVTLSAVLFALAHGSLFQMPYALIAGLCLGFAAVWGKGIFYPLVFHFSYNLLAFFGKEIPKVPLLISLGALALFSFILIVRGKPAIRLKKGKRISLFALIPLLFYTAIMLMITFFNL